MVMPQFRPAILLHLASLREPPPFPQIKSHAKWQRPQRKTQSGVTTLFMIAQTTGPQIGGPIDWKWSRCLSR